MTIHASKGQQAEYVIVLGLQKGRTVSGPARESIMEQALLPVPEDFLMPKSAACCMSPSPRT
jgi:DNA helicase-4